jgi:hypothetical protein
MSAQTCLVAPLRLVLIHTVAITAVVTSRGFEDSRAAGSTCTCVQHLATSHRPCSYLTDAPGCLLVAPSACRHACTRSHTSRNPCGHKDVEGLVVPSAPGVAPVGPLLPSQLIATLDSLAVPGTRVLPGCGLLASRLYDDPAWLPCWPGTLHPVELGTACAGREACLACSAAMLLGLMYAQTGASACVGCPVQSCNQAPGSHPVDQSGSHAHVRGVHRARVCAHLADNCLRSQRAVSTTGM